MTTSSNEKAAPQAVVRKSVLVNAPQERAFAVFVERHGAWWPLQSHHIGAQPAQTAIIEPYTGGRWFERASDGTECEWGRVLVWERPHRLVLSWNIGADWKYDGELMTEVEVKFTAEGPNTTRVELEHRYLDRYGDNAEMVRSIFDSDAGWSGILQRFADAAVP